MWLEPWVTSIISLQSYYPSPAFGALSRTHFLSFFLQYRKAEKFLNLRILVSSFIPLQFISFLSHFTIGSKEKPGCTLNTLLRNLLSWMTKSITYEFSQSTRTWISQGLWCLITRTAFPSVSQHMFLNFMRPHQSHLTSIILSINSKANAAFSNMHLKTLPISTYHPVPKSHPNF